MNSDFAEISNIKEYLILHLKGRINIYEANCIQGLLDEKIKNNRKKIIINLSDVNYISSSFIGILASYKKKIQDLDGVFEICTPNTFIIKILTVTNLIAILNPYKDEQEIIAKFS